MYILRKVLCLLHVLCRKIRGFLRFFNLILENFRLVFLFSIVFSLLLHVHLEESTTIITPSTTWSWSYGSWIYNYLCNQWVRIPQGEVYWIQHYVIKFVSDLRQVGGFFRILRFTPSIKLTSTILLKYCWKWHYTP